MSESYSNRWNKKHRSELNKRRRMRRKLKRQHVKELENQVKLIPKLKTKIIYLQSKFDRSESNRINELELKKQNIKRDNDIQILKDKLNQIGNFKF